MSLLLPMSPLRLKLLSGLLAWMLDATIRGGMAATRPPIRSLGYLPDGLIQGAGYFSVQDGMIVCSIGPLPTMRMPASCAG